MKHRHIHIFFSIIFFVALNQKQLAAQPVTIKGRVIDATSLEPIAFANVFFKNTTTGTITDFEGQFELTSSVRHDSLSVSFVGYHSITKALEDGKSLQIDFRLQPTVIGLSEVVILPGENPAVTILKKVWENKDNGNIDKLEAYQFNSYAKTQVYLRRLFNRKAPKDTASSGMFNTFSLTSDEHSAPALPVYMSETYSGVYNLKFPEREKVVLKATNTNSLAEVETDMLTQLIQKSTKYNFYNNFVRILDKNFVSPISTAGLFYYKYYLVDSLFIDNRYCYEIRVVPKRSEDLSFSGTIWINDSTYALKRISVEVGKQANLNFVERIKIQQDLSPDESGVWYPERTRILADAVNIFVSAFAYNSHFLSNKKYPLSFYDTELLVADTAHNINEKLWEELRPANLNVLDQQTIGYIDSLKQKTSMKIMAALVNMSIKGFVNLGKIEIGPYLLLYKHNEVEGSRFRLGFRTNSAFSKQWIAKGFLAYGTKDEKYKYNGILERFISRKNWTKIGIQYSEDVENLGALDEFYSSSAFLSFASSFGGSDKLNSIKTGRVWVESDLFKGFTQKIVFKNKHYTPLSPDYYFAYYSDEHKTRTTNELTATELTFTSIYQPKATFIIDKNERFPVALKKSPAFTVNYTLGFKDILGGSFRYQKASLNIKQSMHWGGLGFFTYDIRLSKCFTPLPYPLLNLFPANESFFRTEKTFNMMKYGEFIADESVELFCTYRQDGFILDKLPLIKKLKLRSVATASLAYGSFDMKKSGIYHPNNNPDGILAETDLNGNPITLFKTLDKNTPYMEVSYGVENIFRVFRVDAIHRLTYLKALENQEKPSAFGVKIGAVFRF